MKSGLTLVRVLNPGFVHLLGVDVRSALGRLVLGVLERDRVLEDGLGPVGERLGDSLHFVGSTVERERDIIMYLFLPSFNVYSL